MERQEPRFDKDMKDVEFRPRSYRGSSQSSLSHSSEGFAWKIGVAVGVGVLAALLIFSAYKRHQARRDVEAAMRVLEQENAKLESEMPAAVRSVAVPPPQPVAVIHPVPPSYRCAGGRCCIAMATAGPRSRPGPIMPIARWMESQ